MKDKLLRDQVNESVKQILRTVRQSSTATAEVSLDRQEEAIEAILRAALHSLGIDE